MYLSILALAKGLADATKLTLKIFPGHQMPSWLMTINSFQKVPLPLMGLAFFCQVFGNGWFVFAMIPVTVFLAGDVMVGFFSAGALNLKDIKNAEKKANRVKLALLLLTALSLSRWLWDVASSLQNRKIFFRTLKMFSLNDLPEFGTKTLTAILLYLMKKQLSYVAFTDLMLHSWVQSELQSERLRQSDDEAHILYQTGIYWACQSFDSVYNKREWRRDMTIPNILKETVDMTHKAEDEALHMLHEAEQGVVNLLYEVEEEALHILHPTSPHDKRLTNGDNADSLQLYQEF
jgi:hypothetical protein